MNMKKYKVQPSILKPSATSAGSSEALKPGSMLPMGTVRIIPEYVSPIQAAQQLLARWAVKILMEQRRKSDD
jgi:hypothetical protein